MKTALIACGALARELLALVEKHGWNADVLGVSALLHNRPERIADAVKRRIAEARETHDRVIVVYGDCGTGGELDRVLAVEGVERVAGPHCYEMYGGALFDQLMDEEPGTYFLTDFLVRSFNHLVVKGLGLDRYPQLRDDYFGHYRRVVYLAQRDDPVLLERARKAAASIQLPLEVRPVGYSSLELRLIELMEEKVENNGDSLSDRLLARHPRSGEDPGRPQSGRQTALGSLSSRD